MSTAQGTQNTDSPQFLPLFEGPFQIELLRIQPNTETSIPPNLGTAPTSASDEGPLPSLGWQGHMVPEFAGQRPFLVALLAGSVTWSWQETGSIGLQVRSLTAASLGDRSPSLM